MLNKNTCLPNSLRDIDVHFDFTSDTPGFWDGFWERNSGLGAGNSDPDSRSPMARRYHQLLWSRQLPNGEVMKLEDGFVDDYLRKLYTIGGMILLPSFRWCLNQARGCCRSISDRWDLTLECIRRYYSGEQPNPLYKTFENPANIKFFSLFVDFKGFVDFFFLQDCVTEDYRKVIMWLDTPTLFVDTNPIPKTVEDYFDFINKELTFVNQRNKRIEEFCRQG